ncbi:hypothetical protein GV67_22480 [Pseudorhizobium pelagicum]|uniref:O-antigen ligase domain-containing protein n=2 Tax=Pseudorhizobium pelagicum TaxID=1509405 RepID=A0A922P046_9HYPH|nr:hypothetical protein GV67_22480 [Pseudorhizobium pelagicum]KEQ02239.1 hypothetical protein GV68_23620 [Pseudorhizobium pelagicum]
MTFSEDLSQILSPPLILMIYIFSVYILTGIRTKIYDIILFLFVIAYTLASAAFYELSAGDLDFVEFVKSFVPFSVLCVFILISCSYSATPAMQTVRSLRALMQLGSIHATLLLFQFIEMNLLGSMRLLNPFGPLSKIGPYGTYYRPVMWDAVDRPNGFFSEPSAAAWFTGICLAACLSYNLITKKPVVFTAFILLVGMASTFSLSGVVNASGIIGAWLLMRSKQPVRLGRVAFVFLLAGGVVYAALAQTGRLQEYQRPGSSTYVRVIAPAILASEVLLTYPLGLPLGQWKFVASRPYFIQNEALQKNESLDNGLFVIITYLGWLGVAILLFVVKLSFYALKRKNPGALILIAVLMAIAQSGALWTPLYIIIISFAVIVVRATEKGGDDINREGLDMARNSAHAK